jgi:hypothetical protein
MHNLIINLPLATAPRHTHYLLNTLCQLICLSLLTLGSHSVQAFQAWSYQLESQAIHPELVSLEYANQIHKAEYLVAHGSRKLGAVILLCPTFDGSQYDALLQNLRYYLRSHGWSSLAISTPYADSALLAYSETLLIEQTSALVTEGMAYLRQRGDSQIALLGKDLGATLATHAGHNLGSSTIFTIVSLNRIHAGSDPMLSQLSVPVLELEVGVFTHTVAEPALKTLQPQNVHKIWLPFSLPRRTHPDSMLNRRVRGWLQRQSSQLTLTPSNSSVP